ncbi:hypothetical protein [Crinalium epipsammum]|uniref:hypothetical protein n=1 Tax=Crinalium epipsammum TaxID=241425 RepID=UPI00031A01CE|nr:hypothetical protein [Crinalium epipsammum]
MRLTGGLAYQDNRIDATGKARENGTFTIGDRTFTSQEVGELKAKASFPNSIAPYLGIGFVNPVRRQGLGFSVDLGVLFSGSPEVELRATNPNANQQLRTQIENERKQLEDDLNGLSVYPVLSVGVSYGF